MNHLTVTKENGWFVAKGVIPGFEVYRVEVPDAQSILDYARWVLPETTIIHWNIQPSV